GFVGSGNRPIPLDEAEVRAILHGMEEEEARPKVAFDVGDPVRVVSGPFVNFTGVIDEVNLERGKLRVIVSMFGRETPAELEFHQVEKTLCCKGERWVAKKVIAMVKIQIPAGKATPAPPVGTALGPHGINIMDFCKAFNAQTAAQAGMIIPVEITIYADRSFSFITKTPPAAVLLKQAAGLEKGSGVPNREKV